MNQNCYFIVIAFFFIGILIAFISSRAQNVFERDGGMHWIDEDLIQTGDLILSNNVGNGFDDFNRFCSGNMFSHSGIALKNDRKLKLLHMSMKKGCCISSLKKNKNIEYIVLPLLKRSQFNYDKFITFAHGRLGDVYKYDFFQAFFKHLNLTAGTDTPKELQQSTEKSHLFCSNFVIEAYEAAGLLEFKHISKMILPFHFIQKTTSLIPPAVFGNPHRIKWKDETDSS